jgi:hypothetical protein
MTRTDWLGLCLVSLAAGAVLALVVIGCSRPCPRTPNWENPWAEGGAATR